MPNISYKYLPAVFKRIAKKSNLKSYHEVQDAIDDKIDQYMAKGMSWKEANTHPEVEKLYSLRDAFGNIELGDSYKAIFDTVDSIIGDKEVTKDILSKVYLLNKESKDGLHQYFASKYTPQIVSDEKNTAQKVTKYFLDKIAKDEYKVDSADILLGDMSPLTLNGKNKLLRQSMEMAKQVTDSVSGYFGGHSTKVLPAIVGSAIGMGASPVKAEDEALQEPIVDPIDMLTGFLGPGSLISKGINIAIDPVMGWVMQNIGGKK